MLHPVSETMTTSTKTPPTRIIAVTSDHLALTGDGNAALFLAQVLFWWRVNGRKPFYKFNSPCEHDRYRPGDSWLEELHLKRTMLCTARRRVAAKVQYIHKQAVVQAAFDAGALVVYGTDLTRTTYYHVNEALLQIEAPDLYARLCTPDSVNTASAPVQTTRPTKTRADMPGAPSVPTATPAATNVATPILSAPPTTASVRNAESHHSVMQGFSISNSSETASEMTTQALAEQLAPPPTHIPTVVEGEGEELKTQWREIVEIVTDGLQQRSVQDNPARLIAWRAVRTGMGVAATLDLFDAHLLDAQRASAKSPVGVAVSRMVQNRQILPAPAWALSEVARRNRERAWEERQAQLAVSGDAQVASGVEGSVAAGLTPAVRDSDTTTTLWEQVLADIKLQVTRVTFDQRFKGTWLEQRGDAYLVYARDASTVEWLQHRLYRMISDALTRWGGTDIQPQFACSGA